MSADQETPPSPEETTKAGEQSSTLLGLAAFLNNEIMMKPDFGPNDLVELTRGLQGLARRLNQEKKPLKETEIMPGMRAVNISSRDLQAPQPPAPPRP